MMAVSVFMLVQSTAFLLAHKPEKGPRACSRIFKLNLLHYGLFGPWKDPDASPHVRPQSALANATGATGDAGGRPGPAAPRTRAYARPTDDPPGQIYIHL